MIVSDMRNCYSDTDAFWLGVYAGFMDLHHTVWNSDTPFSVKMNYDSGYYTGNDMYDIFGDIPFHEPLPG